MKKLSLELEKLAVESFDTAGQKTLSVGTVRGNALEAANDPEAVAAPAPASKTCLGNLTCDWSLCYSCQLTTCYTAYPCCQIG
ncbi:MAG TPA: hypothetical protein VF771_06360 [Longimicrobiaceae bacterium]